MTAKEASSDADSGRVPALPVRLVQVFVSPGVLFDRLRERPVWFTALAVGALLVLVSILAIPTDVWVEFFRAQMLEAGQPVPEGLAERGAIFRGVGAAAGTIFWFVYAFLIAGVATLIFSFVLGDDIRYRQMLAGVSHALFISALGGLLLLPLRIARENPQMVLSVGTFAPGLEGWPGAFLRGLDLFTLWAFAVLGIAVSRFDRRRSGVSAALVLMLIVVGLAGVVAFFQA